MSALHYFSYSDDHAPAYFDAMFACPREQEFLFENILRDLARTPEERRVKLVQQYPGVQNETNCPGSYGRRDFGICRGSTRSICSRNRND